MAEQPKYVNIVPFTRIKKEIVIEDEDTVHCRLCYKGFASETAVTNHARMEHSAAYATGDSSVWIEVKEPPKNTSSVKVKTEQVISDMEPTNLVTLASNDVSYIIIKNEDQQSMTLCPSKKRKVVVKKDVKPVQKKEMEPITGPFECLQPSTLVADGTCHQIFFSCCEYSLHFRDEHTRRRKAPRCQVCEKPLSQPDDQQLPYPCEVCAIGFETRAELSEHTEMAHIKLKPYECSICHKRFTQQGGVQQHMRMHTGDRPFPCSFCPKAFTQKSGLDQHLRIHTKVKPYRCVVCNKTFCQSVHLKQHMRTHTNVAPFQCGICEKRFKQSSHLNYHLKNHNTAIMTEEQRIKYGELIGLMNAQVQVELTEVESGDVHVESVEQWCVNVGDNEIIDM